MNILDEIDKVKPSTWENLPLPFRKNYALKTLPNNGEFVNVLNVLNHNSQELHQIREIKRVQHPFAYCSFLLRQKQLEIQRGFTITPTTVFIKINKSQLEVALEYNLDERRLSSYLHSNGDQKCLVIAKCLRSTYYSMERDSEIYPEYVVYYK